MRFALPWLAASMVLAGVAWAETYPVGPSRTIKNLQGLPRLMPGDVVLIDGDATYAARSFRDPGAAGNPITIRGVRVNGKRPVISGGTNTIAIDTDHYVVEELDITGGSSRCFYHHGNDVTLRSSVVHDCPGQGILGADEDSGSLLLEYVEVYNCGAGDQEHQIYIATDNTRYPNAVFRMQFCYLHDGNGGNGVKSRAGRNEIYYNWIEGSFYHEVELIGADGQPENAVREDSDVVGNVIVKAGGKTDHFAVRIGGDGTGQSKGRYRFAHNTFIMRANSQAVFRLFDGIESLQVDNNVIWRVGSGTQAVVRDAEVEWVGGSARTTGRNNWILTAANAIPASWTGTVRGSAPGLVDVAGNDLRPADGSPLINAGATATSGPAGFEVPGIEPGARFMPQRAALAIGGAVPRPDVGIPDLGALEHGSGPPIMVPDAGVVATFDAGPRRDGGGGSGGSDAGGAGPGTNTSDGGCRVSGTGHPATSLVLLALLVATRRRRRTEIERKNEWRRRESKCDRKTA